MKERDVIYAAGIATALGGVAVGYSKHLNRENNQPEGSVKVTQIETGNPHIDAFTYSGFDKSNVWNRVPYAIPEGEGLVLVSKEVEVKVEGETVSTVAVIDVDDVCQILLNTQKLNPQDLNMCKDYMFKGGLPFPDFENGDYQGYDQSSGYRMNSDREIDVPQGYVWSTTTHQDDKSYLPIGSSFVLPRDFVNAIAASSETIQKPKLEAMLGDEGAYVVVGLSLLITGKAILDRVSSKKKSTKWDSGEV